MTAPLLQLRHVTKTFGTLVANEMAPRPHNSGHYSIDACDVSQFDLQVRAMTGAPLVAPRLHSPSISLPALWSGTSPIKPHASGCSFPSRAK